LKFHPDKNPAEGAESEYLRIKQAYETLMDPCKKRDYLLQESSPGGGRSGDMGKKRHTAAATSYSSTGSGDQGFRVVAPWFYGLGLLAAFASFLGNSISESRALENERAWERYIQERKKDGLAPILGYHDNRPPSTRHSHPPRFS
jgi:DnaJ-class molecular chaperone